MAGRKASSACAWQNPGRSTTSPTKAGEANPTLESLDKIAGALGTPLGELVAEK
jgi:transcriptional regulator with XRE-family HTH domain